MERMYDETKYLDGLDMMLEKYDIAFQDLPRDLPPVQTTPIQTQLPLLDE
jgi:hypothetical protein